MRFPRPEKHIVIKGSVFYCRYDRTHANLSLISNYFWYIGTSPTGQARVSNEHVRVLVSEFWKIFNIHRINSGDGADENTH